MKKLLLIFLFSLSVLGAPVVKEGECIALPSSKKYISFDSSLDYPKKYQFTCDFECRAQGEITKVTALHNIVVKSLVGEARDVVCYGVKVKRVSWGYDFDRVEKFFSFEAGLVEVSKWAKISGVSLDHENSKYLMDKLVKDLNIILPSYRIASDSGAPGAVAFGDAVEIMELLLTRLPLETELLDQLVSQIPSADLTIHSGLSLVLRILSSSAKWRLSGGIE